ncbi:MAG: glycoside hydrolase family 2 protein [Acidimicrobiales bacterium]
MDLGGTWLAAEADEDLRRRLPDPDLDDAGWEPVPVPGQWRLVPAFAGSDGPLAYRRRFEHTGDGAGGRRTWLVFNGIFYQADVWLDGSYLGDTEGYFAPHAFEVTGQAAGRREHSLAVEVACTPQRDVRRKRNLTGIFQHWDTMGRDWNPGGIWAPVRLLETGPVRMQSLRVACREATPERAILELDARLDATEERTVRLRATVSRDGATVAEAEREDHLAAGDNRVRWRVTVERPALWWPRALGEPVLHALEVVVECDGEESDRRRLTTGLRQIRMAGFVTTVNGERIFLKGANLGPTDRALSTVTDGAVARDLELARGAGLDLLRVHAHIGHPVLYAEADRTGMLLWQDLPLQWGYGNVRRQALRQAGQAVGLLGHHPSIVVWCAHNEPLALDLPPGGRTPRREVARFVAGQMLPTWNKTFLDPSVRRTLERADPSRPALSHSGIFPHPAWGTDTHVYFGWYHGELRQLPALLARWPAVARFVSEFGAQAVPATADFLEPHRWPDLDWDRLAADHALQKHIFDQRVPPSDHASFDDWCAATQRYQATVVRFHVETLRRLKYRPTGGFAVFLLGDAQPAVSWALVDHERVPKEAYGALAAACAPVIVVADWPAEQYAPGEHVELAVHVVSDRRRELLGAVVDACLGWEGGGERRWRFTGDVPADACVAVGSIVWDVPSDIPAGRLTLDLDLRHPDARAQASYSTRLARLDRPAR